MKIIAFTLIISFSGTGSIHTQYRYDTREECYRAANTILNKGFTFTKGPWREEVMPSVDVNCIPVFRRNK